MKDLNVTVRVRNNQLLARRRAMGLTQDVVGRGAGLDRVRYGQLEGLRARPVVADGSRWTAAAVHERRRKPSRGRWLH